MINQKRFFELKDMYAILDEYQLEYFIKDDYVDIWRNGKNIQINKDIEDLSMLDIVLDEFCILSPISDKVGKRDFPEYFVLPEPGEMIAVKELSSSDVTISMYSIREFKEFRDDKIICLFKSGKEAVYDVYQILNKDGHHPSTTFWFNAHHNRVLWAVIEKIFFTNNKGVFDD